MTILKYYSIVLLAIALIIQTWECISKRKLSSYIGLLLNIPILIYVILR